LMACAVLAQRWARRASSAEKKSYIGAKLAIGLERLKPELRITPPELIQGWSRMSSRNTDQA
jgi:hypothetical protein